MNVSFFCNYLFLIYKSLRRFPYLADLTFELNNNPRNEQAKGYQIKDGKVICEIICTRFFNLESHLK
jgi:hypothetical protein